MKRTLKEVQEELIARGVLDVKFTWDFDNIQELIGEDGLERFKQRLADMLSSYLDGNTIPFCYIGD
jgi:hypothetical protein